jgi:hypothetical protein
MLPRRHSSLGRLQSFGWHWNILVGNEPKFPKFLNAYPGWDRSAMSSHTVHCVWRRSACFCCCVWYTWAYWHACTADITFYFFVSVLHNWMRIDHVPTNHRPRCVTYKAVSLSRPFAVDLNVSCILIRQSMWLAYSCCSIPKARPTGWTWCQREKICSPNWPAGCVTPSKVLELCC